MNAALARHNARMNKRHLYAWDAGNRCWTVLSPANYGAKVIAIFPVEADINGIRASWCAEALDKALKAGRLEYSP